MLEIFSLSPPKTYFPLAHGRYEVTAGLKRLGEAPHFQLDDRYVDYLKAKEAARRENPCKYFLTHDFAPDLHEAIARFVVSNLAGTAPHAFDWQAHDNGGLFLNRLIGLEAELDFVTLQVRSTRRISPLLAEAGGLYADCEFKGVSLFDFLALQTQEDWAVSSQDPASKREWLSAIHLSFPNHWSPAEKIGRPFAEVHKPVAGIGPLLQAAPSLIELMIHKGPWERFAWGISTDTDLNNHHPDNHDPLARTLEEETSQAAARGAYLRIERQVLQGFGPQSGALFLIRTMFRPVSEVAKNPTERLALAAAISGMSEPALVYKGLTRLKAPLLSFLNDGASP